MSAYQSNYLEGHRSGRLHAMLGILPACDRPDLPGYSSGYDAGYQTISNGSGLQF